MTEQPPVALRCPHCGTPIGLVDAAALAEPEEPASPGRKPRVRIQLGEDGSLQARRAAPPTPRGS